MNDLATDLLNEHIDDLKRKIAQLTQELAKIQAHVMDRKALFDAATPQDNIAVRTLYARQSELGFMQDVIIGSAEVSGYLTRAVRAYEILTRNAEKYDPEDEYCRLHDILTEIEGPR